VADPYIMYIENNLKEKQNQVIDEYTKSVLFREEKEKAHEIEEEKGKIHGLSFRKIRESPF
jgi:hypothetical protein